MTTKLDILTSAAANKLMSWKVPDDFAPDCYVSFDRDMARERSWPTGTNLFHVGQAKEMFEHCLKEALAELEAQEHAVLQQAVSAAIAEAIAMAAQGCIAIVKADMVPAAKTPYQTQYNQGIESLVKRMEAWAKS